ncbi:hypothetical protein [Microbacterium sp. SLBN-146]|uniref:hypothetical protein n=1 Tax=Microbacterium sp. SLBN-146 TaxID=2768457 RepID=UPI0021B18502|nr:hypothetical protein [Microbacterium sp. SLBN-146]
MGALSTVVFAGSGGAGFANGAGSVAKFSTPWGIAVSPSGWLYVADAFNHRIRTIDPAANVTTFAGNGVQTLLNGSFAGSSFQAPTDVLMDAAANVYVADDSNNAIRFLNRASSTVTTLAGGAAAGSVDGTGQTARFYEPRSVTMGADGHLYVADAQNHTIRRVTTAGVVTTLAGSAGQAGYVDATGSSARFRFPVGIVGTPDGNLYVADTNHVVRKISPSGEVSTFAGSGIAGYADGAASQASFNGPADLCVDDEGNLYVTDALNRCVRRVTPQGVVSTITPTSGIFSNPRGVCYGGGALYVTDAGTHQVMRITL